MVYLLGFFWILYPGLIYVVWIGGKRLTFLLCFTLFTFLVHFEFYILGMVWTGGKRLTFCRCFIFTLTFVLSHLVSGLGQAAVTPWAHDLLDDNWVNRLFGTLGTGCQSIQWIVNCSIFASGYGLDEYIYLLVSVTEKSSVTYSVSIRTKSQETDVLKTQKYNWNVSLPWWQGNEKAEVQICYGLKISTLNIKPLGLRPEETLENTFLSWELYIVMFLWSHPLEKQNPVFIW